MRVAVMRVGRYQTVMQDVIADCVICDPPYGLRTHAGQCTDAADGSMRRKIDYSHWSRSEVDEFVDFWKDRNRGWFAVFSCSDLHLEWRRAFDDAGLVTFAPIACVVRGATVRLSGDGPANWTTWLNVARPRGAMAKWRSLNGAYVTSRSSAELRIGGKEHELMCNIVRDYSNPGDLVVDPCAGYGATLKAAEELGRRALGCEVSPEVAAKYAPGSRVQLSMI